MTSAESTESLDQPDERTVRRAVAGAAMGNAVEWFDYAIYSYLVTAIGSNFFPEADPTAQTLLVFAGIAIPFVLRPFGASCSARSATSSAAVACWRSRSS